MEVVPQSSNFTPVHENNDVVYPGAEILPVDIANLRSPTRHKERGGVLISAEADEGEVEGHSLPPISVKVRVLADSNYTHQEILIC